MIASHKYYRHLHRSKNTNIKHKLVMSDSDEDITSTSALVPRPIDNRNSSLSDSDELLAYRVYRLDPASEAYQRIYAFFKDIIGSMAPPMQQSRTSVNSLPIQHTDMR